jgi:hypothetical protein
MKQYDFEYPSNKTIEGVEETLIDQMCGKLDSNVKDVVVKTTVGDSYKNFVVEMENGKELDCEISFDVFKQRWEATVWEME